MVLGRGESVAIEPQGDRRFIESIHRRSPWPASKVGVLIKKPPGLCPAASYPITGQSALCGVADHLIVQCGNAGLIDLHHSARHRLIEATLPELLFG